MDSLLEDAQIAGLTYSTEEAQEDAKNDCEGCCESDSTTGGSTGRAENIRTHFDFDDYRKMIKIGVHKNTAVNFKSRYQTRPSARVNHYQDFISTPSCEIFVDTDRINYF